MTTFRAPSLDKAAPIVDAQGRITPYFQRFWQNLSFTADSGANQSSDIAFLQSQITTINGQITTINSSLSGKAPLASPSFTGTPLAPTAGAGTNTTQIATTAFVQTAISAKAPLASPALTGTPTAPTAAQDANTTQLATTAYVISTAVKRSTFTPWGVPTGTSDRTTFATYTSPTISNPPTQAEVQAISDHLQVVSEHVKALIEDLRT